MPLNRLTKMYPAFAYKGFSIFFSTAIVSMLGRWVQITAQQWLVYTLTQSAFMLGLVGVVQFLPTLFFSLHAGVYIDRYERQKLIIRTQIALMVLAFLMAILMATDSITYSAVIIIAFFTGAVNTLDMPARQAFLPELVPEKNLRNAINLNSITINASRFAGPALAAILISQYGMEWCFVLNGIAYIPAIIGFTKIKAINSHTPMHHERHILQEITEGLHYIASRRALRLTIAFVAIISIFLLNFAVITPIIVGKILHGGVTEFGWLSSALGAGSLASALLVSTFVKGRPRLWQMCAALLVIHLLFWASSFAYTLSAATVIYTLLGMCNIYFLTSSNSMLQMNADPVYRGRIMSVYTLVFLGVTPIGSLVSGMLLDAMPPMQGIMTLGLISGVLILIVTYLWRKPTEADLEEWGKAQKEPNN